MNGEFSQPSETTTSTSRNNPRRRSEFDDRILPPGKVKCARGTDRCKFQFMQAIAMQTILG